MNAADVIGWAWEADLYCEDHKPSPEAGPVFADSETDTPYHCAECGALIPESLTSDGAEYVYRAFRDYTGGRHGSLAVLVEWAREWDWVPGARYMIRKHGNRV
jgi:hypothetical protein